eukprot:symbB.v1.2.002814.t1/scaffold152.1/size294938/1
MLAFPRQLSACRFRSRAFASLRQLYDCRSSSEGYVPDSCQLEVVGKLDALAKSLRSSEAPRGLYLYGGLLWGLL